MSDGTADIVEAFANYTKKPNGFNRANIWLSIITIKEDIKKAESILKLIRLETKNGRFYNAIDLYLPILEKINSASLTQDLNASIQKLKIAHFGSKVWKKSEKVWKKSEKKSRFFR